MLHSHLVELYLITTHLLLVFNYDTLHTFNRCHSCFYTYIYRFLFFAQFFSIEFLQAKKKCFIYEHP